MCIQDIYYPVFIIPGSVRQGFCLHLLLSWWCTQPFLVAGGITQQWSPHCYSLGQALTCKLPSQAWLQTSGPDFPILDNILMISVYKGSAIAPSMVQCMGSICLGRHYQGLLPLTTQFPQLRGHTNSSSMARWLFMEEEVGKILD